MNALRWERPNVWIYPRPLSAEEHREVHMRETTPFGFPADAPYPFGSPADPRLAALRAIHDAMESMPWVGKYRIEDDREVGRWSIQAEGLGRVGAQQVFSLEEIYHLEPQAIGAIIREHFGPHYKTFVRAEYAKQEAAATAEIERRGGGR